MNPQGSLPWFVMDDGSVVAETIAMCEYVEEVLPEPCLVGASAKQRGVVRGWQRRMEEHYCYPAFYGHRSWTASTDCPDDHFMKNFFAKRLSEHHGAAVLPESWKDLCRWARNKMVWLERIKKDEPSKFIAGNEFTIVDVQVYVTLWFFSEAFPHPPQKILEDLQGQLPWVQEWFDVVHSRPACVAARLYREQNMAAHPTPQSQASQPTLQAPQTPLQPQPAPCPSALTIQPSCRLSKPSFNVSGLAFVVTGSTSGLGRGIALCLAQQGARGVLIHGTSSSRGDEVVKEIQAACPGCKAVFHKADLYNPEECASVVPAAEQAFGQIDGLVNSAATCFPRGTLEDTTVELWDSMFQLNTRSVFILTQSVARHMKRLKVKGSIVNIASIAAQGGAPWITAYSASKSAVCSMTKTNACELRPDGIRVNAINMGWCLTDKEDQGQRGWKGEDWLSKAEAEHPMGRLMRPIDVAGTVGHLLSDAAMMLTGSIIDFAPEQITGTYA